MPWQLPALDREQMVEVDRLMIEEFQISLLQMMEHAGRHLARLASWYIRGLVVLLSGLLSLEAVGQVKPSQSDLLKGVVGVGLAAGIEFYVKDHLMPLEPRFSVPNHLDAQLRQKLYWGRAYQEQARVWSDRLIWGVSLTSLVWGPIMAQEHELAALINMEVFAVNSMVTNLAKIMAARERPYHHYGTSKPRGAEDHASFFSGHSSVAFSQAVTNAMLLSESYPEQSGLIWSSLISTAGLTAYLRVAGDMHYCSDVIIGAVAGSFIAWSITRYELVRFGEDSGATANFQVVFKIPLG